MTTYNLTSEEQNAKDFDITVTNNGQLEVDGFALSPECEDVYFSGMLDAKQTRKLFLQLKQYYVDRTKEKYPPFVAGELIEYAGMIACTIGEESNGIVQCVADDDPDYIQEWKIVFEGERCKRIKNPDSEQLEFQKQVRVCFSID